MANTLGYETRYCERCGGDVEGTVKEDSITDAVGWFCSQCGYAEPA